MAGVRISGTVVIPSCSPPFGMQRLSDGSFNVYRACVGDTAGDATQYSDFADGDTVIGNIHNVRLSPDGATILFQLLSEVSGLEEIWVADNVPGSTPTQLLADGTDSFYHPSWAPDSDTFVYVQAAGAGLPTGGAVKKDAVSAIGSPATLKTAAAGFSVYRPQFNFDGTKVAYWYQQNVGSGDELRCMNDDGTGDAAVDTGVGNYDNNNPQQFGWARGSNMIAYDAGANAYVINSDGTGRVAINANGPAAGANFNITSDCWAMDDSFVVVTANLFGSPELVRAELDGSSTSRLNTSHTMPNQTWMRGAFIYNSRVWFAETIGGGGEIRKVASTLEDGTDYRVDLDVSLDTVLAGFFGGDGFVWD
jgi:Tol biopolymer transport system component